ncbi:MAG: aromatic amino acid lyase [Fervidobacterium pennivorans]
MIVIDGEHLTLEDVHLVSRKDEKVSVSQSAYEKMKRSRDVIEKIIESGKPVYGVNTGFGALASVRIQKDKLRQLQKNINLSH